MPNFEADDTGGGYAKPTAGSTVLSGGSANTGNSLTRASVPAASYSPAGGAAAASSLQTYSSNSGSSGGNALVAASRSATPPVSLIPGGGSGYGTAGVVTTSRSGPSLVDITDPMTAARTAPSVTLPEAAPLRYGDGAHGENPQTVADVMNFQGWLLEKGFNPGKIDGWYGDNTMRAYRQYLRDKGVRSYAGAVTLPPVRAELAARQGLRSAGSLQVGAPLIPAPGQPLDPALVPSKNPADLGNTDPGNLKTLIPLEPVKPLPGGVVPLPGDAAFLQQHPEFAPLSTVERIAKGADILTPVEGGYLTEAERLRGQTGATPLPHPISTPNALVAATVPYGPGVPTIGLVPGGLPQGAPPVAEKVEAVKPEVERATTSIAGTVGQVAQNDYNRFIKELPNAKMDDAIEAAKALGVPTETVLRQRWIETRAAERAAAGKTAAGKPADAAKPASLPPESSAPAKGEPGLFERIQQGFSSDMRKLFGGDEPAVVPATPASPKADRAVPSLTTEQALENRAWFDSSPSPVRTQIRRAVDKNGTDIPTEVERYRQEHGERGGGKQSSLDSRAAGQVADASGGVVPAGSDLDQEIAARGGTPTKPGPMGFEFGKIPPGAFRPQDAKAMSAADAAMQAVVAEYQPGDVYKRLPDYLKTPYKTPDQPDLKYSAPEGVTPSPDYGVPTPDVMPDFPRYEAPPDMLRDMERPTAPFPDFRSEAAGGVRVASNDDGMPPNAVEGDSPIIPNLKPADKPSDSTYWFNPSSISGERGGAQPPAGYYTKEQIRGLFGIYNSFGIGAPVDPKKATDQYIEHYKGNFKQDIPTSERRSDGGRRVGRNDVQEGQPYTAPDGSRRYKRSSGQRKRAA